MVEHQKTAIHFGEAVKDPAVERARNIMRRVVEMQDHAVRKFVVMAFFTPFFYGFSVGMVFGVIACGVVMYSR